jgi:hypothetical protein
MTRQTNMSGIRKNPADWLLYYNYGSFLFELNRAARRCSS